EEPEQSGTGVTKRRPAALAQNPEVTVRQARHAGLWPWEEAAGGSPVRRSLERVAADQRFVPYQLFGRRLVDGKARDGVKIERAFRRGVGTDVDPVAVVRCFNPARQGEPFGQLALLRPVPVHDEDFQVGGLFAVAA